MVQRQISCVWQSSASNWMGDQKGKKSKKKHLQQFLKVPIRGPSLMWSKSQKAGQ